MNSTIGLDSATQKFERLHADAIVTLVPGGPNELYGRMAAEITLFPDLNQEVEEYLQKWQAAPSEHKLVVRGPLVEARYRLLCTMFLRLFKRDAFEQTVAGTPEAIEQVELMEEVVGLRQPAPPPPPPKSPQVALDEQVIADYAALSADKFRAKLNGNRAYAQAFNRLSETGAINSRITQLHDGVGG